MDKELKAKWVPALRSGEYQQGTTYLHREGKYCCLGVLLLVAGTPLYEFDQQCITPIKNRPDLIDIHMANQLSEMNDDGKTFAEIADYIEANL